MNNSHERLTATEATKTGSDRSFGFVFTGVFVIVGLLPLLHDDPIRFWALYVAAGFLAVARIYPKILGPLNRAWAKFGAQLHKIVTPVIMGIIFFMTILPTSLLMRIFKKVPLKLTFDKSVESYWVHRTPPGPAPNSMKNQF
jgi:hypothetical protein